MFELPSALFLIADGNEFRFARFYIVYEGVDVYKRQDFYQFTTKDITIEDYVTGPQIKNIPIAV